MVIGASSQIALYADQMLAEDQDVDLTLFLRHPEKLPEGLKKEKIIVGDAAVVGAVRSRLGLVGAPRTII
ncbi:hypothetical protein [Lactobacillus sp.]|uniref:hypothetical protein n=1 Tax=Lactobacillus sp. TaxID=1591 RepID=UPI003EF34FFC